MATKRAATAVAKPETKTAKSVSTPIKPVGICSTCRHLERCLFVKAARQPIWSCDEFDSSGEATGTLTAVQLKVPSLGEGQHEGLCVNCEARTGCAYRKPGVTVVECEHYL